MATIATLAVNLIGNVSGLKSALGEAQGALRATADKMSSMGKTMSVSVTAPLVGFGLAALKGAAEQEQLQVAFTTMLGSAEKANTLIKELSDFSASTPFQMPEVVGAGKQLLAFGVSAEGVQPALTKLGDLAAGVGAPIGDLAYLYGTAKAQGRLFMADVNQFSSRGIPMIEALAATMGVAQSDVRKLIEEGKVGFPEMDAAINHLTGTGSKFGGLMEAQSATLAGLFSTLQDTVGSSLTAIGLQMVESFDLKTVAQDALTFLGRIKDGVINFAQTQPEMFKMVAIFLAAAAALGPLLIGLGWITSMIASAIPVVTALGGAFGFLLGPIGLVIGALAALVYFDVGGIRAKLAGVGEFIGKVFAVFESGEFKKLGGLLVSLGMGREQAYALAAAVGNVVHGVQDLFAAFQRGDLFTVFEDGSSFIGEFAERLGMSEEKSKALGLAIYGIKEAFEKGGIAEAFTIFEDGSSFIGDLIEAMGVSEESVMAVGVALYELKDAFAGADFSKLKTQLSDAFSDIGGAVRDYFAGDISLGGLASAVYQGFADIKTALGTFFGGGDWGDFLEAIHWADFIELLTWENFVSVLSDWGAYIQQLAWDGWLVVLSWVDFISPFLWDAWLTVVDWANYITPIAWDALVITLNDWGAWITSLDWTKIITTVIDWATWIPALTWAGFITAMDWGIYVASLAWDAFIGVLDWATTAGEPITWADFVSALEWANYIVTFTWESFITKLEWTGSVATLSDWGAYISAIDWTAFVVQLLDWATWIPALAWNGLIAVIDWAAYIDSLDWSTTVSSMSDWGAYITSLDWGAYITGALSWSSYVVTVAWGDFVAKLNWPDSVKSLTWDSYLEKIGWASFVSSMSSWGTYISALSWADFVTALSSWGSWITGLSWADFVTAINLPGFANPLTWASFITGVNLKSLVPAFPGWAAIYGSVTDAVSGFIPGNATGTGFWQGGLTWVGERGPELVDLPRGSQVLSNQDSLKLMKEMAEAKKIGALAEGTTSLGQAMQNVSPIWRPSKGQLTGGELMPKLDQMVTTQIVKPLESAAKKLSTALEGGADDLREAIRSTPGLMSTSQVTQKQLDLAALGVPQNFADDWIRHLTDEVVNGVQWADADIRDAALRAGIDPGLPAQVILDMVKEKWNDQSFFANADNLGLVNLEPLKQEQERLAASKLGNQNLMSFLGLPADQVQGEGVAVGTSLRAGITQGIAGSGGGAGMGSTLVSDLTGDINPKTMAPVAGKLMDSISAVLSSGEAALTSDFGTAFATLINDQLEKENPFAETGAKVLSKITESWASLTQAATDLIGPLADAMNVQLDSQSVIEGLMDVGARMVKIVFAGFDEEALGLNWVGSVQTAATSGGNVSLPGNALGTQYWRGGATWVGERGPELVMAPRGAQIVPNGRAQAMAGSDGKIVIENFHARSDGDVISFAYQVDDLQQRRRRR